MTVPAPTPSGTGGGGPPRKIAPPLLPALAALHNPRKRISFKTVWNEMASKPEDVTYWDSARAVEVRNVSLVDVNNETFYYLRNNLLPYKDVEGADADRLSRVWGKEAAFVVQAEDESLLAIKPGPFGYPRFKGPVVDPRFGNPMPRGRPPTRRMFREIIRIPPGRPLKEKNILKLARRNALATYWELRRAGRAHPLALGLAEERMFKLLSGRLGPQEVDRVSVRLLTAFQRELDADLRRRGQLPGLRRPIRVTPALRNPASDPLIEMLKKLGESAEPIANPQPARENPVRRARKLRVGSRVTAKKNIDSVDAGERGTVTKVYGKSVTVKWDGILVTEDPESGQHRALRTTVPIWLLE